MHLMEINRRELVTSSLAISGSMIVDGLVPRAALASEPTDRLSLFAAARRVKTETTHTHTAALFTKEGDVRSVPLPGRGHDVTVRPMTATSEVEVVAFARRPGTFAVVFSPDKKRQPFHFFSKAGRHFYGHGVFSPDGKLLYTSENDFENGDGVLGVRDATDGYKQIGEFSSFGIGPHDMALLDDGVTLVIANGGIETNPEFGRQILNLAEMEPSLVYINRHTGALIEKQTLPKTLHQLSIRHLTVARKNRIVFGCQFKGAKSLHPPLMGFHDRGGDIKLVTAPEEINRAMNNYVGSVTVDRSGDVIAASCPRSNMITYWDALAQKFLGTRQLNDGCGVARTQNQHEFLQTSGAGHVLQSTLKTESYRRLDEVQWDNHAVFVR